MKRGIFPHVTCLFVAVVATLTANSHAQIRPGPKSIQKARQNAVVSEQVAILVRPILDEKQEGTNRDESRLSNLLYELTQKKDRAADEALVVLMCFDIGESQEEADAVIARGKRMLPYLKKYRDRNPKVPHRTYGNSILKGGAAKADTFDGAIKAINHGWQGTGDNPEG